MLEIIICEDELSQLRQMKWCVENAVMIDERDMRVVLCTPDPQKVIEFVEKDPRTRIYFLDVELENELDGFALGSKIRRLDPNGYVFYFSAHKDRACLNYTHEVGAINYIVKPNNQEALLEEIKKCLKTAYDRFGVSTAERRVLRIEQGDEILYIEYKDILYFKAEENRHIILQTVTRRLTFKGALKDVEKLDENFLRCHRSFVVNTERVIGINRRERIINLTNGSCKASQKGLLLLDSMQKKKLKSLN